MQVLAEQLFLHVAVAAWDGSDGEWEQSLTWHVAVPAVLSPHPPTQQFYCVCEDGGMSVQGCHKSAIRHIWCSARDTGLAQAIALTQGLCEPGKPPPR